MLRFEFHILNFIIFSGFDNLVDIISGCLNDASDQKVHGRASKHEFMLGKVRDCIKDLTKIDKNGKCRPVYDWKLGDRLGLTIPVCRECFAACYGSSHNLVDACCKEIRPEGDKPEVVNAEPVLNDRTAIDPKNKQFYKDIQALLATKGESLTPHQRAMMYVGNTVKAMDAYQWMDYFFTAYGCKVSNCEQIHIDHMEQKELWKEYEDDVGEVRALGYHAFLELWYTCFPHVRVREYKQCCGKCITCLKLTEARRGTKSKIKKDYISRLFYFHRITFMGERKTYAERRYLAREFPEKYLSTISDGMAQLHCLLPYFANNYTVNVHYKQHIQGIINHGRTLTLYRTFNNIANGSNLAIHTWLMNLEDIHKKLKKIGKRLPDTIFAQIDGGSENANTTMKAICELMVARGLTKRVVMTRLPPGHTHEDIDAVFGKIWKYVAGRAVYTPQGYRRILSESLRKRNIDVIVVDVMCVPNYRLYMNEYIDPKLARWDKEKWTELQWSFEAVEKSDLYPHGVKVTYRKYSADEVFLVDEFKKPKERAPNQNDEENAGTEAVRETETERLWKAASPAAREHGFDFHKYKVNTHPVIEKEGDVDGMYVLRALPDGSKAFQPQPFVAGSRKELEKLVELTVKKFWDVKGVQAEWEAWRDHYAPQSDDATEWCRENPMKIPFLNELFSGSTVDTAGPVRPVAETDRSELPPEYETTNSVLWSNRGNPSKKQSVILMFRNEFNVLLIIRR